MLSLFVFDARIPADVCARAMRGDHHGRLQGIDVTNLHIAAAASIVDAHMPCGGHTIRRWVACPLHIWLAR